MQEASTIRYRIFHLDPEDMALEMIHVLTVIHVLLAQWTEVLQAFSLSINKDRNISVGHTHVQKHPGKKTGKNLNRIQRNSFRMVVFLG